MLKQVFLGATALGLCVTVAPAFANTVMAAHRAVYDLDLKRATDRAGLAGVDGRMAIEIEGSDCDGWTVNFRMANEYRPREGNVRVIDSQSASWEAGDGLSMRYDQREFVNGVLDSEKKASASLQSIGGGGHGQLEKPSQEKFDLAPGTIFAVWHQKHLMDIAEKGEAHDSSLVYDGSDGANSFRAISFLGARREPGKSGVELPAAASAALSGLPSWPVTISYFAIKPSPDSSGEATPAYQVSFSMFENGVAGDLLLDYGDYVLEGKLTNFELISQPPCK